ncbi:competence protein CoiA [Bacillus infantis]|uniref:Competence protein CoiA n=1 Tax=Bacillus infantis TaxID=324767 RepID=A0A5D4R6M7_9BACI|nr:competence protein CoiA family protein [Bacillus infantis]TYS46239.1 competence protein CoiA [Bacillus infantis]
MLTAIRQSGKFINCADFTDRETLRKLKVKEGSFLCPVCREKVMLKVGIRKIPHFAHFKEHSCEASFESESEYHMKGKLDIYRWLMANHVHARLETYIKSIKQRPDICFVYAGKKFAVEFQCSPIPESLFASRTRAYREAGFTPIWILGGKEIRRTSAQKASFSEFHYSFVNRSSDAPYHLLSYCPGAQSFIFLSNICPLTTRNVLTDFSVLPLHKMKLPSLLTAPWIVRFPPAGWHKEICKLLQTYTLTPNTFKHPFYMAIYQAGLHLSLLPPHIGIPVRHSPWFSTPPLFWQGYIHTDCFTGLEPGDKVTENEILQSLKRRIRAGDVKVRELPLAEGDYSLAVAEYLSQLSASGIFQFEGGGRYRLAQDWTIPKTMNDAELLRIRCYERIEGARDICVSSGTDNNENSITDIQ